MKKATTTNETTFICVKPIIKAEYTIRIVDRPFSRPDAQQSDYSRRFGGAKLCRQSGAP